MKINELLPIGSVVRMLGGEKRLMIFGVKQSDESQGTSEEYDYIGVMYPEGNIGSEYQFLFNHEDIVEVFFRGFEDEERQNFLKQLSKAYDKK
ncbi:MAG TPA: DUF4176 domain-containing protein [Anaerovoracaceae bacterium]|nr:DUF4176 domain-containing protein [Anaerovoracaceae bacterium]